MKYIKKFESFRINEEFIGMDFSKMKEAIKDIADAFENEIFPNLSEEEKKMLLSQAEKFGKKHGITTGDQLLNKIESDLKNNSDKVEQLSESVINEGFWQELKTSFKTGWKKFLSKALAVVGSVSLLSGILAFMSDLPSYTEWGSIMIQLHDVCRDILGTYSGPIGVLMMVAGVLLALGSMVWKYNLENK